MKTLLQNSIHKSSAGYCDAMFEDTRRQVISFNKKEIRNVSTTVLKGGRITALNNGGYAGASFTRLEDLDTAVQSAEKNAALLSAFDDTNGLVSAPRVNDTVVPEMKIDPRGVDFDEKVHLVREYMDLILNSPRIFTAYGTYCEIDTQKTYVNSEGTTIDQTIVQCYLVFRIMAKNGKTVESLGCALGFDSDFSLLKDRHEDVLARAKLASDLLDAAPVAPGVHSIVADRDLCGVFVHEAFGHLSEADDTVNNDSLRNMLVMGNRMGEPCLNIIDDGTIKGSSGSYAYDDEGVRSTKTFLVKNGILTGRLHSRLTAHQLEGELTGNYRACDYRFMPLVRMSNIFIGPGTTPFDELLEHVGTGYYLCGGKGGQTMGDIFTFGAQYGFEIRNGKLGRMVKDINISGNVFKTLGNIKKIGDDFAMSEGGGCGKTRAGLYDMQMLDKSGTGGPSVLIDDVIIGG